MRELNVSVSEFRARFYQILSEVAARGTVVVITKRGKPVAKMVPVQNSASLKGRWKGKARTIGDIVNFDTSDEWESSK